MTHRCHNRAFLLKFDRDRERYRSKLREHLTEFEVSVLDYCLTSNHVHLLIDAQDRREVSGFMRQVAGEFARAYNPRKGRQNAYWGDNFHATLVDRGDYLAVICFSCWTEHDAPVRVGGFFRHRPLRLPSACKI